MSISRRSGFIVIEASLTTFLIATAGVALVTVYFVTLRASTNSEYTTLASNLSLRLMEEVRMRKWDERSPVPSNYTRRRSSIGVDGGETSADKTTFDDIDDFNGWKESPPLDPMMRVIPGFSVFSTSVAVRYVSPTTLAPSGGTTDFKQISVCTWTAKRKSVCLDTLITNH